jgi:hypothetical protein
MSEPLPQTSTGRTVYPPPNENPACICTNPMQSFFCAFGHLLECHYPHTCREANCSHMDGYEDPGLEAGSDEERR